MKHHQELENLTLTTQPLKILKIFQFGCWPICLAFSQPDVFLWTSMVTGYEQDGDPEEAFGVFLPNGDVCAH